MECTGSDVDVFTVKPRKYILDLENEERDTNQRLNIVILVKFAIAFFGHLFE